ncbi:MAG: lysylphosphatidylglycerol synthase transmembrane domain-containing protein [Betaproteobacteria bacterium]
MRRYGIFGAKLAVSVVLLWLLFRTAPVGELWASVRRASLVWLAVALGLYFLNVLFSIWRWHLLLETQDVHLPARTLLASFMVALFFNNFLPSNIGGDVIRIRDTMGAARSKTVATTVVLADRVIGVIVLALISAVGATMAAKVEGVAAGPIWPSWLWTGFVVVAAFAAPAVIAPGAVGRLLQPLTVFHPEWIGDRIDMFTGALRRFRERPGSLATCFVGAVLVQGTIVVFYTAIAYALGIPVAVWHLAIIVPLSFVIQMLPVSVNGFGVREATFALYFSQIGLPKHSGLLLSLVGAALMMAFSLLGAPVYISRGHH